MSNYEAMSGRFQMLPEGEYDAVVAGSEDKKSLSGNPMIVVNLDVYDKEGRTHQVKDYLVFIPSMMWKVGRFAESANLDEEFMQQQLYAGTIFNKSIRVKIGIEAGKLIPDDKLNGKPSGSMYPTKNIVTDYVKMGDKKPTRADIVDIKEDDIPF